VKVTRARAFPADGKGKNKTIYNEQSPRAWQRIRSLAPCPCGPPWAHAVGRRDPHRTFGPTHICRQPSRRRTAAGL